MSGYKLHSTCTCTLCSGRFQHKVLWITAQSLYNTVPCCAHDIMCTSTMSWSCDWGQSAMWAYRELCISLGRQDYKNSSLDGENSIMVYTPGWHLPIQSILSVPLLGVFSLFSLRTDHLYAWRYLQCKSLHTPVPWTCSSCLVLPYCSIASVSLPVWLGIVRLTYVHDDLQCVDQEKVADYEMKLMNIDMEHLGIPVSVICLIFPLRNSCWDDILSKFAFTVYFS